MSGLEFDESRASEERRAEVTSPLRALRSDGVYAAAILATMGMDSTCFSSCDVLARCVALGVRDGDVNKAIIFVEAVGGESDIATLRDSRGWLAVAVVAKARAQERCVGTVRHGRGDRPAPSLARHWHVH